jgi:hypothetical protein
MADMKLLTIFQTRQVQWPNYEWRLQRRHAESEGFEARFL